MALPELSDEQRRDALAKAAAARQVRAEVDHDRDVGEIHRLDEQRLSAVSGEASASHIVQGTQGDPLRELLVHRAGDCGGP